MALYVVRGPQWFLQPAQIQRQERVDGCGRVGFVPAAVHVNHQRGLGTCLRARRGNGRIAGLVQLEGLEAQLLSAGNLSGDLCRVFPVMG